MIKINSPKDESNDYFYFRISNCPQLKRLQVLLQLFPTDSQIPSNYKTKTRLGLDFLPSASLIGALCELFRFPGSEKLVKWDC